MNDEHVIVRDVPYLVWLFGLGFMGLGGYLFLMQTAPLFVIGILSLIGLLLVLFVPIITVSIDRARGLLVIQNTGIFRRKRRELLASGVARVKVERKVRADSDGISTTYRVVVMMQDGEEIPLRQSSSSGYLRKAAQADRLRIALGLVEDDPISEGIDRFRPELVPSENSETLQALTGITPGVHESQGVRWELAILSFGGIADGSPVYRWNSADFETPGYFVYLAQKMEGQGNQKILMNLAGNLLFKQSMKMYGFDESFAPGLETATTIEDADRRLLDHFFVHTSNLAEAQRVLNPWVVMPLIGWADRYALEKRSKKFHQLTVLFSPWGVYLSVLNTLDSAQIDELVALGVELVRAQGSLPRQD
jgi:hypothetical protein